jgi:hypothetical protein
MPAATRQFFTVDLRGLRAALAARAARLNISESDVLRSALAAALTNETDLVNAEVANNEAAQPASNGAALLGSSSQVKLSTRLSPCVAARLNHNVRAAGLSRGAYLARLIEGAPPVMPSADRKAGFAALSASADELALLSRDIHHLTVLLKAGDVQAARPYRAMLDTLDGAVRAHLAKATSTLTELSVRRKATSQPSTRALQTRNSS